MKHFSCSKKGLKTAVKKLKDVTSSNLENSNDKDDEKDDSPSEESKESKKNSKETSNTKDNGSKNFVCDECGNRLSTRKSLKRHKRIHLRPAVGAEEVETKTRTKYECEVCKKGN